MEIFSPQQIKFEFLSYMKEFGGRPAEWRVGCSADAAATLASERAVDLERDPWIWKPALSPAAARLVHGYFVNRLKVQDIGAAPAGATVLLFKPGARETTGEAAGTGPDAHDASVGGLSRPAGIVQRKSNTLADFLARPLNQLAFMSS